MDRGFRLAAASGGRVIMPRVQEAPRAKQARLSAGEGNGVPRGTLSCETCETGRIAGGE